MINIKGLNKYYPLGKERFHALKDIDLEVKQGEMLCLTGRSGSGKSTLLHVIGCWIRLKAANTFLTAARCASFRTADAPHCAMPTSAL